MINKKLLAWEDYLKNKVKGHLQDMKVRSNLALHRSNNKLMNHSSNPKYQSIKKKKKEFRIQIKIIIISLF